jgi:hypothetical protein
LDAPTNRCRTRLLPALDRHLRRRRHGSSAVGRAHATAPTGTPSNSPTHACGRACRRSDEATLERRVTCPNNRAGEVRQQARGSPRRQHRPQGVRWLFVLRHHSTPGRSSRDQALWNDR